MRPFGRVRTAPVVRSRSSPDMTPRSRQRKGSPTPDPAQDAAPGMADPSPWALLDALPGAAAAFAEDDGRLLACNAQYRDQFGALEGHASRNGLLSTLQLDVHGGDTDAVHAAHNGRWYALHWGYAQVDGREVCLLTALDISARIEAMDSQQSRQEKLLFTSRLMSVGEMAATLAHELNQPLAAIVNYLNGSLRLLQRAGGPAQVDRALQAARTQAEHASSVIARVREFVRAREPRRDAHAPGQIVATVLELLRLEAERNQLRIDLALNPHLPDVYADRVMVEQVLLNLVKNGIEAMREQPASQRELRVEGRVNLDGEVEIRVCDRGHGLGSATQDQLFSPFFSTKSDGLGIGLAICRSIIEYHEGRLFFEPRPGGGSVFGFTLPTAAGRV
ncbi:MAG: hypothetical protein DI635_07115 [Pseudoxanthomonas suwonensis]|nr:MAG: hypothetical protein DI635_07115 [Pseudoxanthomonas suwonensis]